MPDKKRPYSLADIDRVDPNEVYKYLVYEKGVPETHAVAMVNNMKYESGYDPYVQGDYMIPKGKGHRRNSDRLVRKNSDGDFVYMDYNKKGKAGLPVEQEYLDAIRPQAGGMFQHQGKRYENLLDYSNTKYVPGWQTQMDFAMTEPQTKRFLKKSFDNPESASKYFTKKWEVPANAEQKSLDRLENLPNLLSGIDASSSDAYALNELEKEYALPPVTISANKFAQGGAHNINNMNKRYYATGGVNPSLVESLIKNEGFIGVAYPDLTGETTIGYGYTKHALTGKNGIPSWKEYWKPDGTPIKRMSEDEANKIREVIVQERVDTVNNNVDSEIIESLSQEQYNSLVDLVYRNGSGNLRDSGLWDVINKGKGENLQEIAEFIVTSPNLLKAGGKVLEEGDDGYNGITARNKRAASTFDKNQGSVNPVTDNMARANGDPTSEDINNELFGGFESAEAQQAATDAYYANTNQQGIIDNRRYVSNTLEDEFPNLLPEMVISANQPARQNPEDFQTQTSLQDMTAEDYARVMPGFLPAAVQDPQDFQTQGTPEEEAAWYAKNTNQAGIIDRLVRDYAAQQPPQNPEDFQTSTPLNELTAEDYARLGIDSEAIANRLADDYAADDSEDGFPMRRPSMLEEDAIARDAEIEAERIASDAPMTQEEIDATKRDRGIDEFIREDVAPFVGPPEAASRMATATGNLDNPDVRPKEGGEGRKPNLGNMDYMGLLSSLGGYAARMGPLRRALNEADEWDKVKYPRYDPALLDATVPKRDVRDAYTTAMSTAGDQGKLDLGALALLATKQAQEVSRVEENLSNQNAQIKNQAQQLNNQITMQELNDTAANKGAAQTMRYQILNDMGKAGEMSIREYNMQRNDANVKNMFAQVFGDEFGKNKSYT